MHCGTARPCRSSLSKKFGTHVRERTQDKVPDDRASSGPLTLPCRSYCSASRRVAGREAPAARAAGLEVVSSPSRGRLGGGMGGGAMCTPYKPMPARALSLKGRERVFPWAMAAVMCLMELKPHDF